MNRQSGRSCTIASANDIDIATMLWHVQRVHADWEYKTQSLADCARGEYPSWDQGACPMHRHLGSCCVQTKATKASGLEPFA